MDDIQVIHESIDCWVVKSDKVELYILVSLDDINGALYRVYNDDYVDRLAIRSDKDAAIEFAIDWIKNNTPE